ncbi:hypothetical protein GDO81_027136 [Engystomops pustulosus]|uniref:Uncharacterized protein n=1 Tax=Engystomops pustulosus TaxID=76066 RepID=A0AAV6YGC3_ENGPU|nr:hypothetical protein GDO81_027136 [Engystomops pustulosus]
MHATEIGGVAERKPDGFGKTAAFKNRKCVAWEALTFTWSSSVYSGAFRCFSAQQCHLVDGGGTTFINPVRTRILFRERATGSRLGRVSKSTPLYFGRNDL